MQPRKTLFLVAATCASLWSLLLSQQPPARHAAIFETSDRCVACHNGIFTRSGEDISFGKNWQPTMMANSGRDPYWLAGVRREVLDYPSALHEIQDECSKCHMPMMRYEAHLVGGHGEIFVHFTSNPAARASKLALDGVSCTLCHGTEPSNFGKRESFVGGFRIAGATGAGGPPAFGPYTVERGRLVVMRSSSGFEPLQGAHIRQSELCATCHTLYTKALVKGAESFPAFPEQVPYQEWLHSEFRHHQSCQSCHMRPAREMPITSVLPQPHPEAGRHNFLGGNFFLLRVFARHTGELWAAAQPQQFELATLRTLEHLQQESARLSLQVSYADPSATAGVRSRRLAATVTVENLVGHKLPTAYPSRRAWLHLTVRDRNGKVIFESGAPKPDGSISGNDNDLSPDRYEPHYLEIHSPDQVQIYEGILGDPSGRVTTGLLAAVQYLKDNRLLPRGFDKRTADRDIAVHGSALGDPDFAGGADRVTYLVDLAQAEGPLEIEVRLLYQPVSYRWAQNLRPYNALEIQRFVRYFEEMSGASAACLARAAARLP